MADASMIVIAGDELAGEGPSDSEPASARMQQAGFVVLAIDGDPAMGSRLREEVSAPSIRLLTAHDLEHAADRLRGTCPGVVLLDPMCLSPQEYARAIDAVKARWPAAQVIVRTDRPSVHETVAWMQQGALTVLEKQERLSAVLIAIGRAMERATSGAWERRQVQAGLEDGEQVRDAETKVRDAEAKVREAARQLGLSEVAEAVLVALVDGLTTREIAVRTCRSPKTIEYHIQVLKRACGGRTRAEVVARVLQGIPGARVRPRV
jgi:DNA-binding NarL/FixJ family response regulator